jgi:hypothetical protein
MPILFKTHESATNACLRLDFYSSNINIWTKNSDSMTTRTNSYIPNGDKLQSGHEYTYNDLFADGAERTFYVQALAPGSYSIHVTYVLDGEDLCTETVAFTSFLFESVEVSCDEFDSTGSFGSNPVIFEYDHEDNEQADENPPYWYEPGTSSEPSSKALKVFYKFVKDSNGDLVPFNIDLKANIVPANAIDKIDIQWGVLWNGLTSHFDSLSELEVQYQNMDSPGYYKFYAHVGNAELGYKTINSYVLFPEAGGEVSDWLIDEIPVLYTKALQWKDDVEEVAVANGVNVPIFLHKSWILVASNYFDYQGIAGDPTPRYSFTDDDRPLDHIPTNFPGMRGNVGNGDWDEPSFCTLKGVVVSRAKINNLFYAVWGKSLGYERYDLKIGAYANAIKRGLWDDSTSQDAVDLGCDLYDAYVDNQSLSAVLTKERALELQTPDSASGLNDVNLSPITNQTTGFLVA